MKGHQVVMQDLNLGGGANVVNFARVTNVVSNPGYPDWEARGLGLHYKQPQWGPVVKLLEANAYNGFKQSRNLYFHIFFHCLMLHC